MSEKKERLIVVLGPTAVGKTKLAVELAKKLGSRVISGDSMLVYKGFDIGTAKPDETEKQGVCHELIDILEPVDSFNVTDFVTLAKKKIRAANEDKEIPILAGGTGLYVKSLLEGYEFNVTAGDEAYRAELQRLAEEKGGEYLYKLLLERDPEAAARIDANNVRRVIRALEVQQLGGETISTERQSPVGLCYDVYVVGLRRERAALYERINQRVDLMIEHGLIEEVKSLLNSGVPRTAQAMQGIGYKEIVRCIDGEWSYDKAVDEIKKGTRHFAKRQLTWYRKMPYIIWYDVDEMNDSALLEKVYADVRKAFAFKAERG